MREAISIDDMKDELADVLEVILAFASAHGITLNDITQAAEKKRATKGAFDKMLYLDSIDIDEDHPNVAYFKARPDKYPEVDN